MMGHSSTSNLCICLYVCVFVIVFVISERQWIVGVMSFQKIYDLIGWLKFLVRTYGRIAALLEVRADLKS